MNIRTLPYVTTEMLHAGHWLKKTDFYGTLLNTEEISRLNDEILRTPGAGCCDIKAKKFEIPRIASAKDYKKMNLYLRNRPLPPGFLEHTESKLPQPSEVSNFEIKFGFCVKRADIKLLPVAEAVSDDPTEPEADVFQLSGILPGEPVAILSCTKDKKWFFIETYYYSGWVAAQNIGVCRSKKEWLALMPDENFVVITAFCSQVQKTLYPSKSKGLSLPMGTILRIPKEETGPVNGRYGCFSHAVLAPCRGPGGVYEEAPLLIPFGDAAEGFLPLTAKNILTQTFKHLGAPYGWGGMLERTDCSQLLMQVMRCCGLMLPRDTKNQFFLPLERIELYNDTPEMKARIIKTLPPASILRFKGHTMIYLGAENNRLYVISNLYSAIPEGFLNPVRIKSVAVNELSIRRPTGHTWLEDIDTALLLKA